MARLGGLALDRFTVLAWPPSALRDAAPNLDLCLSSRARTAFPFEPIADRGSAHAHELGEHALSTWAERKNLPTKRGPCFAWGCNRLV
jgi:hypothetical protein